MSAEKVVVDSKDLEEVGVTPRKEPVFAFVGPVCRFADECKTENCTRVHVIGYKPCTNGSTCRTSKCPYIHFADKPKTEVSPFAPVRTTVARTHQPAKCANPTKRAEPERGATATNLIQSVVVFLSTHSVGDNVVKCMDMQTKIVRLVAEVVDAHRKVEGTDADWLRNVRALVEMMTKEWTAKHKLPFYVRWEFIEEHIAGLETPVAPGTPEGVEVAMRIAMNCLRWNEVQGSGCKLDIHQVQFAKLISNWAYAYNGKKAVHVDPFMVYKTYLEVVEGLGITFGTISDQEIARDTNVPTGTCLEGASQDALSYSA